jgi:hypothetical protein
MGRIHGPRCDDAVRCWPWKQTEGVGRRRGRSSPAQRRRGGSPAGKVGVQWLGKQLRAPAKLLDMHTRTENECGGSASTTWQEQRRGVTVVPYRRRIRGAGADEMQRAGGHLLYMRALRDRVKGWLGHGVQRTVVLEQRERACTGVEHSEGGQWQGLARTRHRKGFCSYVSVKW